MEKTKRQIRLAVARLLAAVPNFLQAWRIIPAVAGGGERRKKNKKHKTKRERINKLKLPDINNRNDGEDRRQLRKVLQDILVFCLLLCPPISVLLFYLFFFKSWPAAITLSYLYQKKTDVSRKEFAMQPPTPVLWQSLNLAILGRNAIVWS